MPAGLAPLSNVIAFKPRARKPRPTGYAPTKGLRLEILDVLASIAAYQAQQWKPGRTRYGAYRLFGEKPAVWCIVRQRSIIAWYLEDLQRLGRSLVIKRRTLAYHLAGLIRDGYLLRETRHIGDGRTKLKLRPSLYTLTPLGRLWIKRDFGRGKNRSRRLAVQNVAQSGSNPEPLSLTSLSSAVDNTIHSAEVERATTTARPQLRTASDAAAPRPKKAPVRKGAAPAPRTAPGARAGKSRGPRKHPTKRRS